MNNDSHIILNKELRRDIDAIIQRVKLNSGVVAPPGTDLHVRKSRERSIVITKLQEAVMWLGMDLKAINEEYVASLPSPYLCGSCEAEVPYPMVVKTCPSCGGNACANNGPHDNPAYAAAKKDGPSPNPYPNSKDPSNTKIEPTADGLKP